MTDVFPALALGVGEGNDRVMGHPPRSSDEPLMTKQLWKWVSGYGVVLGVCTLGAFLIAHEWFAMDLTESITVCFLTLAFGQLCHVFNMRDQGAGLFNSEVTRNPFVWGATALCTVILLLAVYAPPLAKVLQTTAPGLKAWATIIPMSIAPVVVDVVVRKLR